MEPNETTSQDAVAEPVAAETTSAPQLEAELTPPTEEIAAPEGVETPVETEEDVRAQELIDWAVKKYPVLEGKSEKERQLFLIEKSLESNTEGRRLSRRVKELEQALTARVEQEEYEPVDLEEVAPPPALERLGAQINTLTERQRSAAERVQRLGDAVEEAKARIAYAKGVHDSIDDSEPDKKARAWDQWETAHERWLAARVSYQDAADKYQDVSMSLAETQTKVRDAEAEFNALKEQRRKEAVEIARYRKQQDKIFDLTAERLAVEHNLDDETIDEFRDRVRFELDKNWRRTGTPVEDLAKFSRDVYNKFFKTSKAPAAKPKVTVRPVAIPQTTPGYIRPPQQQSQAPMRVTTQERLRFASEQARAQIRENARALRIIR